MENDRIKKEPRKIPQPNQQGSGIQSDNDTSLNAPRQGQSKSIENQPDKNAQREKFCKDYPKAVEMLKSIKIGDDDTKNLRALIEIFMGSGFVYTMTAKSAETFLKGNKEGDCSTLARAYEKIAKEYLGIEDVKTVSKNEEFFVPNGGRVLDANQAKGNVDNGQHWVFTNHYWVESPIGDIDLLFLGQAVNKSQWIEKTGEGVDEGIEYRQFGDYRVYESNQMGETLAGRYATNRDEAREGKAAQEAAEAAFIEANNGAKTKRSPNVLNCCTVM